MQRDVRTDVNEFLEGLSENDKNDFLTFCKTYNVNNGIIPKFDGIVNQDIILDFMPMVFGFIIKYYVRTAEQNYSMEDYISECIYGLMYGLKVYKKEEVRSFRASIELRIESQLNKNLLSKNFGKYSYVDDSLVFSEKEIYRHVENEELRQEITDFIYRSSSNFEIKNIFLEYLGIIGDSCSINDIADKYDKKSNTVSANICRLPVYIKRKPAFVNKLKSYR